MAPYIAIVELAFIQSKQESKNGRSQTFWKEATKTSTSIKKQITVTSHNKHVFLNKMIENIKTREIAVPIKKKVWKLSGIALSESIFL